MISSLKLRNFQSHKHTDLEFVPGVNVIIGQSDSGKTAIIRALQWVVTNRPSGEAFRSDWGGDTEVHLGLDKEKVIVRERAKENRYVLWTSPTKEQVFQGFSTDVPETLAELIGFDDINIQAQHDSPFLLSANSAEVARTLNKVAHLDDIDYSLSSVNSMIRQVNSAIKEVEFGLGEVADGLERYDGLVELEATLEGLERAQSTINSDKARKTWLTTQISLIEGVQSDIDTFAEIAVLSGNVQALTELERHAVDTKEDADALRKLIQDIRADERAIENCDSLLKHKNEIDKLISISAVLQTNTTTKSKLNSLLTSFVTLDAAIKQVSKELSDVKAQYDKLMPDTCPLCGQGVGR